MDLDGLYVIRYTYPGTSNGEPVGDVYVQALPEWHTRAMGGKQGYSYSKDPKSATWFRQEEAARVIAGKPWPNAQIVELGAAKKLS